MKDYKEIFVSVAFFHMQFSKYFTIRNGRQSQLGGVAIYNQTLLKDYETRYNTKMDYLFDSEITQLFTQDYSKMTLYMPYSSGTNTIDVIYDVSIYEYLFEMTQRVKIFTANINSSGNLDMTP